MTKTFFFHIYTSSKTPCHLTDEADAEAQRTWLCKGCCSPKPGVTAINVHLRESPAKEPLNFVFGAGISIISNLLLDALGRDLVRRELYVGEVYGPDRRKLHEWATFRGKHRLIVRGSKEASYRTCDDCGQIIYFAMGKKYLYPKPPTDISIFDSGNSALVLTEQTFLHSGIDKLRGIYADRLTVANEPKDMLGELATS